MAPGDAKAPPEAWAKPRYPTSRRYDRVIKLRWYAQVGVPEYWVVDPDSRTLEQLALQDGTYAILAALEDEETLRPETFPGLEVPLAKLWDGEG